MWEDIGKFIDIGLKKVQSKTCFTNSAVLFILPNMEPNIIIIPMVQRIIGSIAQIKLVVYINLKPVIIAYLEIL